MKWTLIFKNEMNSYFKSDKGLFFLNLVLVLVWGMMFSSYLMKDLYTNTGTLWFVFFSVIISSNFSNSTFISERMNGMLEILLVSGIPRKDILFGKVLHVFTLSSIMGILVYFIGILVIMLNGFEISSELFSSMMMILPLYFAACFLNICAAAWLSVKLSNPRFIHFVNLFILAFLYLPNLFLNLSNNVFLIFLLLIGCVFYLLALKEYRSENVTKPLIF